MFKALTQFKSLLSSKNLQYLDAILTMLTDRQGNPVYDAFWNEFTRKFPQGGAANGAWAALRKLHDLVKQQLKEQKP